jgi:hypothetical protein
MHHDGRNGAERMGSLERSLGRSSHQDGFLVLSADGLQPGQFGRQSPLERGHRLNSFAQTSGPRDFRLVVGALSDGR